MKMRFLGKTGLKVSEICLGTMTFGGRGMWTTIGTLDQKQADELVNTVSMPGLTFLILQMFIPKAYLRKCSVKPWAPAVRI
jgi:predicted aldo/keto reductase-like oxidoreductase